MHVAWIASRGSWSQVRQLAPAWIAGAGIGVAANANIQVMELLQHGYPPSIFYPDFPRDLVFFLVGAPVLLSLGLWLSTAALGLWTQRRERWLWAAIAVVVVVVAALLWGLRPAFLYPRFFMFLIPGCAYLMAAAIARWRVLVPVVVAGAGVASVAPVSTSGEGPLAPPPAAPSVPPGSPTLPAPRP